MLGNCRLSGSLVGLGRGCPLRPGRLGPAELLPGRPEPPREQGVASRVRAESGLLQAGCFLNLALKGPDRIPRQRWTCLGLL